ncbi:MAG: hypothetical protein NWR36_02155 [Opitutales bacterium]|nr:hypothetical protein [Opitutales bacterium]
MDILPTIILGAICGLIGAFAMNLFMRGVSTAYSKRVDMVRALGSFFTGKLENASLGFGFFHGLITSYGLMFYACERHPIEEYRKATLEEGLLHLVGHVIFGGVAGLLGGLIAMGMQ